MSVPSLPPVTVPGVFAAAPREIAKEVIRRTGLIFLRASKPWGLEWSSGRKTWCSGLDQGTCAPQTMWPRRLDASTRATDAQREVCAAYIKSQTHEGWALIATRFDDGGFSGANLERPALRTLLEAIEQRRIDVFVYKVDRLTHRSPISPS